MSEKVDYQEQRLKEREIEERQATILVKELFKRCMVDEEISQWVLFDVLLHEIKDFCFDPSKPDDDISAHSEVMSDLLMRFARGELDNTTLRKLIDDYDGDEYE